MLLEMSDEGVFEDGLWEVSTSSDVDDRHDLDVGEMADLSEISDVVANASEFDLND